MKLEKSTVNSDQAVLLPGLMAMLASTGWKVVTSVGSVITPTRTMGWYEVLEALAQNLTRMPLAGLTVVSNGGRTM